MAEVDRNMNLSPGGTDKPFDLEERTHQFAAEVGQFVKRIPRTICNIEDVRQLAKASGSVGANYIEANESLGKKDFLMRARISRKEAKESRHFLRLLDTGGSRQLETEREALVQESSELLKILSAIINKSGG